MNPYLKTSTGQTIHPDDPNYSTYAGQGAQVVEPAPSVVYKDDGTREVRAPAQPSETDEYYEGLYRSPEEIAAREAETKADFAKRVQDQIFAIDEAYAPIYQQAYREGEGRLGSTATINALAGQRGSPSGAANVEQTTGYNSEIRRSIDARKNAEVASIRQRYDEQMTNELRYQETLRRQDADKYLEYLSGKEERDREIKQNRLNDILSTNIAFEELDEDLQSEYADMFGYTLTEARRSWDHKVGTQLAEKEQWDKELARQDVRFGWEEQDRQLAAEDREKAEVAMENEFRSMGWEYIKTADELAKIDKNQFDVLAIKQPGGAPDKLYKVPKGMSELEIYEAKKQIDARYRAPSGDTLEKTFFSAVKEGIANLQKGESWGTVYDRIKQRFPDIPNEEIDTALGMEWKEGGAYEKYKAKNKTEQPDTEAAVWAWLATDEAQDMKTSEKKKEIMAIGLNPADFGIY